jgi:hypothetical protein
VKTVFLLFLCCWSAGHIAAHPTTVQPDSTKKNTPAAHVTGDISLSTGFYAIRGLGANQSQVMPWGLTGNLTLITRAGWVVPVQGMWSSETNQYGQPYNQVGVSPRFRNWLTLHGGYRNVVFSPLTLAGHTFLGAGIELNPGMLRVGAVMGKFNRAIEANYADPNRVATFRRTGYSAKVGLGNARSYLDLILLRVADDAQSLRSDSLPPIAPAENVVAGLSGRFQFSKKLYVEIDAAGSAYTRDVRADTVATTTNPDERFHYLAWMKNLFTARQSTQIYTAVQASLSYRSKYANLKIQYKRIEPNYKSMGAYYFQHDLERFTAAPSVRLFNRRLDLRSSVGWQHDNLLNQKKTRTDRLIGSASASYSSNKNLTLDVTVSNYGITQRAGYRPLNDTARVVQNNQTLSGNVFKLWAGKAMTHTITGSATYQELQDLNPFTAALNQNQNWNYTVSYAWQHLTANLDINLGYSYTLTKAADLSSEFAGPSVEIGKRLLTDNKLNLLLSVGYLKSRETLTDLTLDGIVINTALTVNYQLTPVHRLAVNWTNALNQTGQAYHQQQGRIEYSFVF